MSAWIEITSLLSPFKRSAVALLVSAWIEIIKNRNHSSVVGVALLVSAWIEIKHLTLILIIGSCRTPCECVD